MTTTLSEGVKVPDVGSVNWAGDLEVNWNLLNGALANLSGNVKLDRDNTWTGEQSFTLPIVGSITGTASKAIADEDGTSIKTGYVNVAGNQTVSGNKEFTGSNTFNNILPNATNTYALGSSSYQWSSVYAQSYYYNGTEFLNKFVTTDTSQTINADKEFATGKFLRVGGFRFQLTSGLEPGVIPSSNLWTGFQFTGADRTLISEIVQSYQTNGNTLFQINVVNNETNAVKKSIFDYVYNPSNNTSLIRTTVSNFMPTTTSVTNLGTSTNKWKSLNGLNPGALSLPKTDGFVDITSSITSIAGGVNRYTPTVNGWVSIAIKGGANNSVFLFDSVSYLSQGCYGSNIDTIDGRVAAYIPVIANQMIYIIVRCAQGEIYSARFFPCLGNV